MSRSPFVFGKAVRAAFTIINLPVPPMIMIRGSDTYETGAMALKVSISVRSSTGLCKTGMSGEEG